MRNPDKLVLENILKEENAAQNVFFCGESQKLDAHLKDVQVWEIVNGKKPNQDKNRTII